MSGSQWWNCGLPKSIIDYKSKKESSLLLVSELVQFNKHIFNLHYVPVGFWFPAQFKHE